MISELLQSAWPLHLVLSVNLITTLSYFIIIGNEKLKAIFYRLPKILQKAYVLFFIGPLFIAPFIQQQTFHSSAVVTVIGGLISITGLIFILFSFLFIGAVPSITKSGLVTTGTYSIVRHPIYCGTLLVFMGLILVNAAALTLLYLPLSILLYYMMTVFEEKDLIKIFGNDYLIYRQKVKGRILPFIL